MPLSAKEPTPVLRSPVRPLNADEGSALLDLCAEHPHANAFLAGRIEAYGTSPRLLAGQVLGYYQRGRLTAACWVGANIIPVEADRNQSEAFASRIRKNGRRAVSIVGVSESVMAMWQVLEPSWGPARDVRQDQPLMMIDTPPRVAPDPHVRLATMSDIEVVFPAAVAMFSEEVGYSPVAADQGYAYRQRVAELLGGRRTYASFTEHPDQRVIFKADLGCVSAEAVQVQGVWVDPEFRGRGLSESGMASVVQACHHRGLAPLSLYVNTYNQRAVRAYQRVGFREIGSFSTVLF